MKSVDLLLALCGTEEADEHRAIYNHNESIIDDMKREGFKHKRGTPKDGVYYFVVDYPLRGLDADIVFFDVDLKKRGVDYQMFGYVIDDAFNDVA